MGGPTDNRAVSEVLGTILVFGILVAGLGTYQAVVVPNANEDVEFKHSQAVQADMVELRTALMQAVQSGSTRSATVDLGATYPARVLSVNPAPGSGSIHTDAGSISTNATNASALCGTGGPAATVTTEQFVYEANYQVYDDDPTVRVENSLAYRQYDDAVFVDTDQRLVDGSTVTFAPVVSSFSQSGTGRAAIDLVAGPSGATSVSSSDPIRVTVPTALDASEWANNPRLFGGEPNVDAVVQNGSDAVDVVLAPGTYTFECTALGVGSAPNTSPSLSLPSGPSPSAINPREGAVAFEDTTMKDSNKTMKITFKNLDSETRTISEVRVPFYASEIKSSSLKDLVESFNISSDSTSPENSVGGNYTNIDNISIAPDNKKSLEITFECGDGNQYRMGQSDFFVLSLKFANGETGKYFVSSLSDKKPKCKS